MCFEFDLLLMSVRHMFVCHFHPDQPTKASIPSFCFQPLCRSIKTILSSPRRVVNKSRDGGVPPSLRDAQPFPTQHLLTPRHVIGDMAPLPSPYHKPWITSTQGWSVYLQTWPTVICLACRSGGIFTMPLPDTYGTHRRDSPTAGVGGSDLLLLMGPGCHRPAANSQRQSHFLRSCDNTDRPAVTYMANSYWLRRRWMESYGVL